MSAGIFHSTPPLGGEWNGIWHPRPFEFSRGYNNPSLSSALYAIIPHMSANQPRKRRTDREKYQWSHLPLLLRSNMVQRVFGVSARDIQRWAKEGRLKPVYTGLKGKQPKYPTLQVAALLGLDMGLPAVPVFVGQDLRETITQCTAATLNKFRKDIQEDMRLELAAQAAARSPEPALARVHAPRRAAETAVVVGGGTY